MNQKALTIVKVGGKIIEDKSMLIQLIDKFSQVTTPKILIHGGGRSATQIAEKLGIETTMVNGRRVTNEEMLDVVTMVYGGLINKQLVALLQCKKVNALGLTGADANLILSHKRLVKDIDYGFVGDVDQVNAPFISHLLLDGVVPVVAPLTHDGLGNLLNTNADTIASTCAVAMASLKEVTLCFCFEFDGVLSDPNDESSVISKINLASFQELKEQGVISGGMLPKMENAFNALRSGVKEVVITSIKYIGDPEHGTHITLH